MNSKLGILLAILCIVTSLYTLYYIAITLSSDRIDERTKEIEVFEKVSVICGRGLKSFTHENDVISVECN